MVAPIRQTTDWKSGFDAIIDVRSPSEFADDHIPDAINLPVLSDDERAEVGTIYKQTSPLKARQLGAQYAARNIANHIDRLMEHDAEWRPMIYCWRGGQRSGSMARILAEIGWVTTVMDGGYKTYREHVMTGLGTLPNALKIVLLQGPTGSAKTHILNKVKDHDVQVIDLEGLAVHRGSLLGADPEDVQPSQRMFESRLYQKLSKIDPKKPILVEAESSKIGNCHLPQMFWQMMAKAPTIYIDADVKSRIDFLIRDYSHLIADPGKLNRLIDGMVHRHGYEVTSIWRQLADDQDWPQFVEQLITQHYDPAYQHSAPRIEGKSLGVITLKTLDNKGISKAAAEIPSLLIYF